MNAEMIITSGQKGMDFSLTIPDIPVSKRPVLENALRSMLALSGIKVLRVNENGEEVLSADEVFPDGCPAMALRGLRVKEDITQTELAQRLGISQNMVSDMEGGKRSITPKMAKRIAEEFKAPYKAFL
jgi:DNA-binding XRE family transcriptional regulator